MSPGPLYTNPVYPESFPDPYVLKVRGEYWAYCTGFWPDSRCFGVLRSRDLVHWTPQAGALAPLPGGHPCYWAPEVVEHAGLFYLYYSVGNEERMEIRVAVADRPGGPFADCGHRLTSEPFAIDAHVFTDPASGVRYLFYATDFLESPQIGTGTVVDRLLDPFTLEGRPRPVALPRFDWHVYHPNRPEKGGVRWHTVEGPFVLERKGLYYEMFSGGNWQNPTYGVSYATIATLDGPGEWVQAADGEGVLPILRTSGEVVGPGHNSVVRGPDNRQLWCVYHRWSFDGGAPGARVLAIDPLDWAGERLLVLGPTTGPQPAPIPPTLYDESPSQDLYDAGATSFLVEVSARGPGFGLALHGLERPVWRLRVGDDIRLSWREREDLEQTLPLPAGFDVRSFHLLRLDLDGTRVRLAMDGVDLPWTGRLAAPAHGVSLLADGSATELAGFALTVGWEELFVEECDATGLGWQPLHSGSQEKVTGGRLLLASGHSLLVRGPALSSYLLVVNARLDEPADRGWTVHPAAGSGDPGPGLTLERRDGGWALAARDAAGERLFPLPESFDPSMDQQLRCRREGSRVMVEWEGLRLGEVTAPPGPSRIGIGTAGGAVSFEMVRVTALPEI
ncbi:MAG TPA: glycoside hydrolase family 43 protein [Thermoanaerobaculia bacterium]|nr:glycoside hydrolase family 43 protein [Thermoanaerobaculia bacterium]